MVERFNHRYPVEAGFQGKTLELGAGLGEHVNYEDLAHQDYFAVDIRDELVGEIQRRHPGVTALVADCQKRLPFGDATFDRVVAVHVLEHLPDLPRALEEVRRVLAPRGRFHVVIPCEGGLAYSFARRISAQRLFEKEFGMSYDWVIRSEHLNVPWEIRSELQKRFRITRTRYFPLRFASVQLNLAIGLTLVQADDPRAHGALA